MRWFVHLHHTRESGAVMAYETRGRVITFPGWRYDLMAQLGAKFYLGGSERALRHMTINLVQLQRGETVLDVGCGTGTLAMIAKERVGPEGRVSGIDLSASLLATARRKAARRGLSIDFQLGVIEQLAFPDQSFEVVLSSMMMHQLPDDLKVQGLTEIVRVLKPGGCLLVLDFRRSVHGGPWNSDIQDLPALMQETAFRGLGFALGRTSRAGGKQ
jgi:ubiquinone/menaquinone biosynthesis C-methylase UbiE